MFEYKSLKNALKCIMLLIKCCLMYISVLDHFYNRKFDVESRYKLLSEIKNTSLSYKCSIFIVVIYRYN